MMDHWDFVENHIDDMHKLARRMCRGRFELVQDMVQDMVCRVPDIFDNWNPTMDVPVDKKCWIDLKWYMWKWMNRRMKTEVIRYQQLEYEEEIRDHRVIDLDAAEEVQSILDKIDPYYASLLALRLLTDHTFEEMSEILDVSKGTARQHYLKALAAVREAVGYDGMCSVP